MTTAQIVSSIIISIIAATGGTLAARQAAKAQMKNVTTTSRVEMEKEAYERARKMDTATIEQQERKIAKLEGEVEELEAKVEEQDDSLRQLHYANDKLHQDYQMSLADNRRLREEIAQLRVRFTRFERGMDPESTERIRLRETDTNPVGDYRNGRE
jgi:TolA-binding protein